MNITYIEQHYTLSVSTFEGLWKMSFQDPYNKLGEVTVYVIAPNSNYNAGDYKDYPIIKAGERLTEVMTKLIYQIDSYPYTWDLAGQKLAKYAYDFETDYLNGLLKYIELTEVGYQSVNDYYGFYSPLEKGIVGEDEKLSGKGIMSKLQIDLNGTKEVNHLSIDFFTEYPIELVSVMYKEDSKEGSPYYEIPLVKEVVTSNSLYIHFPTVSASIFLIVFRQGSYTLLDQFQTTEMVTENEAWNQASESSKSYFTSAATEYLEYLSPAQAAIELHEEILSSYKNTNRKTGDENLNEMNAIGEEFKETKEKLDAEQK